MRHCLADNADAFGQFFLGKPFRMTKGAQQMTVLHNCDRNEICHARQVAMRLNPSLPNVTGMITIRGMVTRIARQSRLYLREHRKYLGVRTAHLAKAMGIERESLLRLEREPQNVDWAKAVRYANALNISPARLLKPPYMASLDELVEDQPEELQVMAADIVRRLIAKE